MRIFAKRLITSWMGIDESFGGKVAGYKLKLVPADHQNKADVGVDTTAVVSTRTALTRSSICQLRRGACPYRTWRVIDEKVLLITSALSSEITGKSCSPTTARWTYDTYSQAHVLGVLSLRRAVSSWFFLTADYAFRPS